MPRALAGCPRARIVFTAFVLSGALAGLAGFMFLARFGNITVVAGAGWSCRWSPRSSSAASTSSAAPARWSGVLLGAVMIDTLEQSLLRLQISEFWRDALLGLLILVAVTSDAVILSRLRAICGRAPT